MIDVISTVVSIVLIAVLIWSAVRNPRRLVLRGHTRDDGAFVFEVRRGDKVVGSARLDRDILLTGRLFCATEAVLELACSEVNVALQEAQE